MNLFTAFVIVLGMAAHSLVGWSGEGMQAGIWTALVAIMIGSIWLYDKVMLPVDGKSATEWYVICRAGGVFDTEAHYYTGLEHPSHYWSTDLGDALRFARHWDAYTMLINETVFSEDWESRKVVTMRTR